MQQSRRNSLIVWKKQRKKMMQHLAQKTSLCFYFCALLVTAVVIAIPSLNFAETSEIANEAENLNKLSLEALMDLQISSVSRKDQKLANAAAAVYVVTQEDIRRSGATTIPDLLRLVPGVEVARMDANKWAVSIRGSNGRFANKLLVLMDGRSLYTPLFSGVFWDVQDTVLEDIDRIEVIRGPGSALWGANAVNGVINIITKSARQTAGSLLSSGVGTEERGFATARYGAKLGDFTAFRIYGKYFDRDSSKDPDGNDAHDAWDMSRGGFRIDSNPTNRDTLTLQGDYYDGSLGETYILYLPPSLYPPETRSTNSRVRGGNLLSRWQRTLSDTSNLELQFYYDHTERDMIILSEKRDTFDLDFKHRFALGTLHDIVWGLGYRFSRDRTGNAFTVSFSPRDKSDNLFSAFLHDEISLVPDCVALILGTRFEHNDYSGFEYMPNGRLLWTPTERQTLWGAVSRSVRTPSRADQDIQYRQRAFPTVYGPVVATVLGSDDYRSEDVFSYEIGYRAEPINRMNFDIALFYNDYRHMRAMKSGDLMPPSATRPFIVMPFYTSNDMNGKFYGIEAASEWRPLDWLQLQVAYSLLKGSARVNSSDDVYYNQILKGNLEGSSPRNKFSFRTGISFGGDVTLDLWLRGADRLESIDVYSVPGYITLDARLAWKPFSGLEIALVGRNLLHGRHQEFIPELINTVYSEVERSVYGKVTWEY